MTSTVSLSTTPPPIDDLQAWLLGFTQPTVWLEFAALAACVLLAWALASLLRQALGMKDAPASVLFGRKVFDGALFPLLLLVLGYVARAALLKWVPLAVLVQTVLPGSSMGMPVWLQPTRRWAGASPD